MIFRYVTHRSSKIDLLEALEEILLNIKQLESPLRLVFFASIQTNAEYEYICKRSEYIIERFNFPFMPLISWIAQRPLCDGTLYCEATFWKDDCFTIEKDDSCCSNSYLSIITDNIRYTLLHFDSRNNLNLSIYQQANISFRLIDQLLSKNFNDKARIVRQWNYIERITDFNGEKQHYQMFNDSRSEYYQSINWQYGYPAATGIGVNSGGVIIDLELIEGDGCKIESINNQQQIAAHAYSEDMLLGCVVSSQLKAKSTPKFERAKWISSPIGNQLFISGTAAIRGEESCQESVEKQTNLTLEHINYLYKRVEHTSGSHPHYRIYVKNHADINFVLKEFIAYSSSNPSFLIVQADVCRAELLVEIEAIF